MEAMIGSMIAIGYCRADDGRSLGFPPTAPFLTPAAVITAANAFASALMSPELLPVHRVRLERASLSINFVVLVRWTEMRNFANVSGTPWLLASSKRQFYDDFERIGNATEINLGRGRDSLGNQCVRSGRHDSAAARCELTVNSLLLTVMLIDTRVVCVPGVDHWC
jgi:hypothetical protein